MYSSAQASSSAQQSRCCTPRMSFLTCSQRHDRRFQARISQRGQSLIRQPHGVYCSVSIAFCTIWSGAAYPISSRPKTMNCFAMWWHWMRRTAISWLRCWCISSLSSDYMPSIMEQHTGSLSYACSTFQAHEQCTSLSAITRRCCWLSAYSLCACHWHWWPWSHWMQKLWMRCTKMKISITLSHALPNFQSMSWAWLSCLISFCRSFQWAPSFIRCAK